MPSQTYSCARIPPVRVLAPTAGRCLWLGESADERSVRDDLAQRMQNMGPAFGGVEALATAQQVPTD